MFSNTPTFGIPEDYYEGHGKKRDSKFDNACNKVLDLHSLVVMLTLKFTQKALSYITFATHLYISSRKATTMDANNGKQNGVTYSLHTSTQHIGHTARETSI